MLDVCIFALTLDAPHNTIMTRYGLSPLVPPSSLVGTNFHERSSVIFQLVIYAGPNTNSRKVTEYGGNTLGYGSRSVLGTGWPKDLVKVKKKIFPNKTTQVICQLTTSCSFCIVL